MELYRISCKRRSGIQMESSYIVIANSIERAKKIAERRLTSSDVLKISIIQDGAYLVAETYLIDK